MRIGNILFRTHLKKWAFFFFNVRYICHVWMEGWKDGARLLVSFSFV